MEHSTRISRKKYWENLTKEHRKKYNFIQSFLSDT